MFKKIKKIFSGFNPKYYCEILFWKKEIDELVKWYNGVVKFHYLTPAPLESQKIKAYFPNHSAILTWHKLHQEVKYLEDLSLDKDSFSGLKVLDIGSGPIPSATIFGNCQTYCLDPLLPEYVKAGYPLHYYERVKFIHGFSEDIPVEDNFFDVVISVNSIDHIDDLSKTSLEIKRVLKTKGKIRIHAHYHKKTSTEPLELNDEIMLKVFEWCSGFKKIKESSKKKGSVAGKGESFALWSNF